MSDPFKMTLNTKLNIVKNIIAFALVFFHHPYIAVTIAILHIEVKQ